MPTKFFVSTFVVFVVLLGLLGFDLFHYYQYKLENPKPSDAVVAYEDTSLLPLKDYQRKRILTFVAPEVEDPHGVGSNWNRIQALIAVATGGVSGKGLGEECRLSSDIYQPQWLTMTLFLLLLLRNLDCWVVDWRLACSVLWFLGAFG